MIKIITWINFAAFILGVASLGGAFIFRSKIFDAVLDGVKKELPSLCKEHGFELIEMEDEKTGNKDEDLPVDLYPTVMFRVNEKIEGVLKGYNKNNILDEVKKY